MIDGDDTTAACEVHAGSTVAFVHVDASGVSLTIHFDGRAVVAALPLGPVVAGVTLGENVDAVTVTRETVRESYVAASGKATGPHEAEHEHAVLTFTEDGVTWRALLRVAPHGVAVRYVLPLLDGVTTVEGERTALGLDEFERLWMLDYQTWYETPRFGADASDLAPGDYGFPVLARTVAGDYLLVTESGIDGRFSGSHVVAAEGRLALVPADATTEVTRGEITPWRVFIVGSLPDIVESHFVDELAPNPAGDFDFDWVRPGRAAWSWWSDFYSGAQLDHQKRMVDDAASLGWEHLLIDCGWEETWVPEIVAYASERGIQVHLWTVWRDLNGPENLRKLALWRSWGVAGIKVDFMESESRDRYRWYDALLAEAARVGLMVNVHGSVIPRGWARTWPHLIGYEAARGAEYYVFYSEAMEPAHNVILPFTRNVVGAMDYTPVVFSAPSRLTTDAHELALAVAFECGITHFADDTAEYLARPTVARFLSELAPSWDATLLLGGDPDSYAAIARRSGDRWFVGVVSTGPARTVRVPLDRLGFGNADAWIVGEGLADARLKNVTALEFQVAENGGAVAIVTAVGVDPFRAHPRPVRVAPSVEPAVAVSDERGEAVFTVSPGATPRLPPGWSARAEGDRWVVGARGAGVVAFEFLQDDGVAVVSHARVLARLAPGTHAVSELPFLAFRNQSGPVERNTSNGGGNPRDGDPLTIAGERFESGLGMSAPGWVRLHLGGAAATFTARVGIDDETTTGWEIFGGRKSLESARATAVVLVDGIERARVEVESGHPATPLSADLVGGETLELRITSDTEAHVDWVDALIHVTAAMSAVTPPAGHR